MFCEKQPDNNDNGNTVLHALMTALSKSIFIVTGFAFPDDNWTCLNILSYVFLFISEHCVRLYVSTIFDAMHSL